MSGGTIMTISTRLTGLRRTGFRAALSAAAFAVLVPTSAWGLTPSGPPLTGSAASWGLTPYAPPLPDPVVTRSERPTLQVENNNWLDVHVYLVRDGEASSLGVVSGPGEGHFRMPLVDTTPGSDVQVLILPIGGTDSYLSPSLKVNPSDQVDVTVENSLSLSSVRVKPGTV
jgi:hypothetical protein